MTNNPYTKFESHVIAELAELKTDMKSLVGNGQPGRVSKLESRVLKLMIFGAVVAFYLFGSDAFKFIFGG